MAGEPILVVDDTPLNLKLTRILLVNEGYEVLTAASAEEALELLRTYRPHLILADVQLPGIDGLEMTRRIKQDERTRETLVVALTAFAMNGDQERAFDAGCDDYITKPFDTRSLGNRIRALLDRRTASPLLPAMPHMDHEQIPLAEMQALRHRFLVEGEESARRLQLTLDGPFHAADAGRCAHQWIGTAGLLGFTAICRIAREVESLLHERPVDTAQLRETLTNLILAFTTPREAREIPVPAAIMQALAGKRVALVGLPAPETQRLCIALADAAAQAQCFDLESSPALARDAACDLVVTYVHPQSANAPWLDPASAPALPTLFVGSREDLLALAPAVQSLAAQFLMDSWQPDEALVRLSLVLTPRRSPTRTAASAGGPARVQVSVADSTIRALVHTALQSFGMELSDAPDGAQAAVLDVPEQAAEFYQMLAALRATHPAMRIVLLTAKQREGDILRGFLLGADDYVVKPFSPIELVARLKHLLLQ